MKGGRLTSLPYGMGLAYVDCSVDRAEAAGGSIGCGLDRFAIPIRPSAREVLCVTIASVISLAILPPDGVYGFTSLPLISVGRRVTDLLMSCWQFAGGIGMNRLRSSPSVPLRSLWAAQIQKKRRTLALIVSGVLMLTPALFLFQVSAAGGFATPAFQTQWQQGEAVTPNFWGPLSLARDG